MWSFIKNQIENVGSIVVGIAAEDDSTASQSGTSRSQRSLDSVHEEAIKLLSTGQCAVAASMLSEAVACGHPRSHADLSWLLLWGRDGVFIDHRKAFNLAENGSRLGCDWSKGALAFCYMSGRGVAANEELGFDLASECAATSYGQFCLGYAHLYGIGGAPRKNMLAMKHFASAKGNAEAQHYVGHLLEIGIGVPPDKSEALTWYKASAAQGYSAAILSMHKLLPRKIQKSALETHFKQLLNN
jgi:TPR repeat protein